VLDGIHGDAGAIGRGKKRLTYVPLIVYNAGSSEQGGVATGVCRAVGPSTRTLSRFHRPDDELALQDL
jgi:hypothetical protein